MHPLKEWRLRLSADQNLAGSMLGVTQAQVSRYESGKQKIPAERLVKYEKITGIPRFLLRPDLYLPASDDAR